MTEVFCNTSVTAAFVEVLQLQTVAAPTQRCRDRFCALCAVSKWTVVLLLQNIIIMAWFNSGVTQICSSDNIYCSSITNHCITFKIFYGTWLLTVAVADYEANCSASQYRFCTWLSCSFSFFTGRIWPNRSSPLTYRMSFIMLSTAASPLPSLSLHDVWCTKQITCCEDCCLSLDLCIYMYMYMYVHTYIYIYIYI